MNNKKLGNDFEQELCEILADAGYWTHNFANRKNGQPADIIAVKGCMSYLIDAKVCSNDVFRFSRIEENQRYAMDAWIAAGNTSPYFAVKMSSGVYMVSYAAIKEFEEKGKKQFTEKEARCFFKLNDWVRFTTSCL